jgi:hypothetical protein
VHDLVKGQGKAEPDPPPGVGVFKPLAPPFPPSLMVRAALDSSPPQVVPLHPGLPFFQLCLGPAPQPWEAYLLSLPAS